MFCDQVGGSQDDGPLVGRKWYCEGSPVVVRSQVVGHGENMEVREASGAVPPCMTVDAYMVRSNGPARDGRPSAALGRLDGRFATLAGGHGSRRNRANLLKILCSTQRAGSRHGRTCHSALHVLCGPDMQLSSTVRAQAMFRNTTNTNPRGLGLICRPHAVYAKR